MGNTNSSGRLGFAPGGTSDMERISSGNGNFAIKLYKSLTGDFKEENLFFSPLSISAALAMTLLGAQSTTAVQMKEVLGFSELSDDLLHSGFSELFENIFHGPNKGCSVKLANCLFGGNTYNFFDKYLKCSKKYYGSSLQAVDFLGNPEAVRKMINKWVEEKTDKKIQDLVSAGSVDPSTVLIIANAIYFKGSWDCKFKPYDTFPKPFFVTKDVTKDVKMMQNRANFGYFEDKKLKSKVLDLLYANSSLHMMIVLPDEVDGHRALEDQLGIEVIKKWMSSVKNNATVIVSLPKFTLKTSFSACTKLSELGMNDLFSPDKANLDGMASTTEGLFVTNVLHQAFVEVNEKGTEAAAATAVEVQLKGGFKSGPTPKYFKADHPFLFFIWDSQTKTILFLGKFINPSELASM